MKIRRMGGEGCFRHLDHATESVNSWSEWKREIAGVAKKPCDGQMTALPVSPKVGGISCDKRAKK